MGLKRRLRKLSLSPVEKLILIAMAGIVVALGLAYYSARNARGRDLERKDDLNAIRSQVMTFYALHAKYPVSLSALSDLPATACRDPRGHGDCAKPDHLYKAFKAGTLVTTSSKADCDNAATTCSSYLIYTTAMETLPNPYSLSSLP